MFACRMSRRCLSFVCSVRLHTVWAFGLRNSSNPSIIGASLSEPGSGGAGASPSAHTAEHLQAENSLSLFGWKEARSGSA